MGVAGFGLPRLNIINRIFFITTQDNQVWLTTDCHIASFSGKAILTFYLSYNLLYRIGFELFIPIFPEPTQGQVKVMEKI